MFFIKTGGAFLMLFLAVNVNAQQTTAVNSNPFYKLQFLNSPTDTISFVVTYDKFGTISDKDANIIATIIKNGDKLKGLTYAVGFTIPGYSQKFYAPSKDNNLFKVLSTKQTTISKLKINCVAYRFYKIDNACNFFYIDKASIIN